MSLALVLLHRLEETFIQSVSMPTIPAPLFFNTITQVELLGADRVLQAVWATTKNQKFQKMDNTLSCSPILSEPRASERSWILLRHTLYAADSSGLSTANKATRHADPHIYDAEKEMLKHCIGKERWRQSSKIRTTPYGLAHSLTVTIHLS